MSRLRFGRRRRRLAAAAAGTIAAFWLYVFLAPLPPLEGRIPPAGTVVLAADGTVLQRDTREGIRIPVSLAQVAPLMVEATISAEDQRFGQHPGVDPIAVGRAALTLGSNRSGASTLQQQLARRLYLRGGGGPLPLRKLREMVLALRVDAQNSQDDILSAYLNAVYYGRGAYGVEAAARVYFGTSARNLDLAQAAFLAGLPQLPAGYDPDLHPEAAKARQAYVLGRLRDDGKIGPEAEAAARSEDLRLLPQLAPPVASHFVAMARAELERVRPDLAGRPGLVIETTLDAGLQAEAERVATMHLEELRRRNVTSAAVVVLDPGTGRLLAVVGNAGGGPASEVNMALAERQPGSALKPFLYALALERGYTAAMPLLDVPTTFSTPEGPYSPENYDRRFHGPVTLRTALASSYNIPAVRTLAALGSASFLEMAHRVGLETLNEAERYGLSLTLGGGDVRLLDMAAAYGAFAAQGMRAEPFTVVRVRDGQGRVLYEHEQKPPVAVLTAEEAWLISDILHDPEARVPGFGRVSPLETAVGAAVKTGTTTGFRDNWAIGYTPGVVVAAWVGNADNSAMDGVSGVDGAGPIWRDVIEAATGGAPASWPSPPAGMVRTVVCSPTGLLPGPDCPAPLAEWFIQGTEPATQERFYHRDEQGQLRVNPPAEARSWALDAGWTLMTSAVSSVRGEIRVVQPVAGAVLFRAPELDAQQLLLRATGSAGTTAIELRVDGRLAGRREGSDATAAWVLETGTHTVVATAWLSDGSQATTTSTYEVRVR